MGDARLLLRAEEVHSFGTPELRALLADMLDTMQALSGVGLAAPQIGVNQRVVIFGVQPLRQAQDRPHPRYPDAEPVPQTVLLNPVITPLSGDMEDDWEGCLSVPGMRGRVPRFKAIRYQGYDEYGVLIDRTAVGFHARVVQHECDHLDGVLYPMRMRDLRQFGFSDVLFPDGNVPEE